MTYRYNPFEEMERMIDRMRRTAYLGPGTGVPSGNERPIDDDATHEPAPLEAGTMWSDANVSLEPTEDGYGVMADLPGFERDEIDLRFDDGVLAIRATHGLDRDESAEDMTRHVRHRRRIDDRVRVPGTVDEETVTASYRNGILEVRLPTAEDPGEHGTAIDIE